jgi:hypothetical protein
VRLAIIERLITQGTPQLVLGNSLVLAAVYYYRLASTSS